MGEFVAVKNRISDAPLVDEIGILVGQVKRERTVFVIAAKPLRERCRGDVIAKFVTEFEGVMSAGPAHVVGNLVEIIDLILGETCILAHLKVEVVEIKIWKCVQPGKCLRTHRIGRIQAVVPEPELVDQRRENV